MVISKNEMERIYKGADNNSVIFPEETEDKHKDLQSRQPVSLTGSPKCAARVTGMHWTGT
jgi:hypothetical protein